MASKDKGILSLDSGGIGIMGYNKKQIDIPAHVANRWAHHSHDFVPIQKNREFRWHFKMVDSMDFATPETSKTVTVVLSQDGAAFASLTGAPAVTEVGSGWYYIDVPAVDLNISGGVLKATATGCAQTDFAFYPQ